MKLSDYLSENAISPAEFAEKVELKCRLTVYRYLRGKSHPSARTMKRIYAATNGAVTADDFFHSKPTTPTNRRAS